MNCSLSGAASVRYGSSEARRLLRLYQDFGDRRTCLAGGACGVSIGADLRAKKALSMSRVLSCALRSSSVLRSPPAQTVGPSEIKRAPLFA